MKYAYLDTLDMCAHAPSKYKLTVPKNMSAPPALIPIYHLDGFTTRVIKVVALLGAHALMCVRSSPAITGPVDEKAIKARVVAWARRELSGIDLDKYPNEMTPVQLQDFDQDPAIAHEYLLYYKIITKLLAFIMRQLQEMVTKQQIPQHRQLGRVVCGWLEMTFDKFLS